MIPLFLRNYMKRTKCSYIQFLYFIMTNDRPIFCLGSPEWKQHVECGAHGHHQCGNVRYRHQTCKIFCFMQFHHAWIWWVQKFVVVKLKKNTLSYVLWNILNFLGNKNKIHPISLTSIFIALCFWINRNAYQCIVLQFVFEKIK